MKKYSFLFVLLLAFAAMAGCGGISTANIATATRVAITPITPANPIVAVGATQQLSAVVTVPSGSTLPTTETWGVNGTVGGSTAAGTISVTGLYTAPATVPTPATVTVRATSVADTTQSASTTVTIVQGTPADAITGIAFSNGGCSQTSVLNGAFVNCPATVTGTGNFDPTVDYSASPAGSGTFTVAGVFTPTAVKDPTTITIAAAARGDATKVVTTEITVKPVIFGFKSASCAPASIPNNGTTTICNAMPSGTPPFDSSVSMSVDPGQGSISPAQGSGFVFTPSASFIGTANITVSSVADPTITTSISVVVQRSITIAIDQREPPRLVNQGTMSSLNDCINQCTLEVTLDITGGELEDEVKVSHVNDPKFKTLFRQAICTVPQSVAAAS